MKTIVFAYHDMGSAGITALLNVGFDISAVFTHRTSETDINSHFLNSVAYLAAERDIPIYAPDDVCHPLWINRIKAIEPDVIFSFYYRQLLNETILKSARFGAYNLHGSLLPKYRGRAPLNWVLINGETETGITLHRMTKRADSGDIIAQQHITIDEQDDALTLYCKLVQYTSLLLEKTLPLIKHGSINGIPQNEHEATVFGRRTPGDGFIFWSRTARNINNLVRAVTHPWPGAFSFVGKQKFIIWKSLVHTCLQQARPGTVISINPFLIACGDGALEVVTGQRKNDIYMNGHQLAKNLGVVQGTLLHSQTMTKIKRRTCVLILGVNGFIGKHLTERLLRDDNFEIFGLDINSDAISRWLNEPRFHFIEGDISINSEWIEYYIKKCHVILPLVAIATPIEYTRNPLRVFELNFEENLKIVRNCVKYGNRVIFPSTSEVYGMCTDSHFDEDHSNLVVGPVNKQRWIYSVSKQLLDRIILAYGEEGLRFTLFRPFNWIGPHLDNISAARIGSSRVITQLILNLIEGSPIRLIDGGTQKRCFTYINDGIEALFRIIKNRGNNCDSQIINIGNPNNEASIRQLAECLLQSFESHPLRHRFPPFAGFHEVEGSSFYGKGYQDVKYRKPSIKKAQRLLDWTPSVNMETAVNNTLDFFLNTFEIKTNA